MIHPPSFDMPVVSATAFDLSVAIRFIETERPEMFELVLDRYGLLAAGIAKLMFDTMDGRSRAAFDRDALGVALVRVALDRPEIGRLGLVRALTAFIDLIMMQTPASERPPKIAEMTAWMQAMIALFDEGHP